MAGARRFSELKLEYQLAIVLAAAGIVAGALYVVETLSPDPGPAPAASSSSLAAASPQARGAENEAATIADIRALLAAQEAYRAANAGFYEGNLDCLADPHSASCLPSYPMDAPSFLDSALASRQSRHGYNRTFHGSDAPNPVPALASPTSVRVYRYDATAFMVGFTGVRGFAGASDGRICFTADGAPVPPGPAWGTLPPHCTELP